jgi:hypothetical protein
MVEEKDNEQAQPSQPESPPEENNENGGDNNHHLESTSESRPPEEMIVEEKNPNSQDDSTGATNNENENKAEESQDENTPNVMALNVAYEALEQVRQANVAIEFGRELGPRECTLCLREPPPTSRFRLPKLNRAAPCLTCGSPVCPRHRCPALKRENINICVVCSQFFALTTFVEKVHTCEDPAVRRQLQNAMLDVYDRALLILQYSAQFIDEIASALEHNNKRNDRIGFGSSATGLVSGIAGVAAAVTIFTPAGPPLLIASILFGGGATAASAGSEAVNYHCSANRMADTIYALHGMVHSIARLAIEGHFMEQQMEQATAAKKQNPQYRNKIRATANALKPLTAGALSAASVVMEAREMRNTLDKINAGSPCEKAESLRKIAREMDRLPSTTLLAEVAPRFFMLEG